MVRLLYCRGELLSDSDLKSWFQGAEKLPHLAERRVVRRRVLRRQYKHLPGQLADVQVSASQLLEREVYDDHQPLEVDLRSFCLEREVLGQMREQAFQQDQPSHHPLPGY